MCGFGSPAFKDRFPKPAETDAVSVAALRRAGAIVAGALHMDELAYSLFGENFHFGAPLNYSSPDRVAGGSSSGCGSAVAGGLVDIALGSDTAGSVRVLSARPTLADAVPSTIFMMASSRSRVTARCVFGVSSSLCAHAGSVGNSGGTLP